MMREGRGGDRRVEEDLADIVLSWSVPEIMDDDLYRGKVEKIPLSFMSLEHYLMSYIEPLIEETRSDLSSCLKLISEAPSSKILSMEVAGKSRMYYMDVDFWDNNAGFSTESYTARNGDIFILSGVKPEAAEDFNRYGLIYCLAMVTEVSMDDEYQKGFRVKVAQDIGSEEDLSKFRHAIFLSNIMTNIQIWKALSFDSRMNNNFTIIKPLLAPKTTGDDICGICVKQEEDWLSSFAEKFVSVNLNQSQLDAIESIVLAVRCRHFNLTKLIWGPPGTGKTKTISALLWALACLKCRTLTCAPTNVAVAGVCARFLQNLKDFNGDTDEYGLPLSLGDVLLFGNKYRMDIAEELQDIFLDHRSDELVECFSSLSGWRYRFSSMVSFFEDCISQYDMLLEDDRSNDHMCFLDYVRKQFNVASKAVKKCIVNIMSHLPRKCFTCGTISNISALLVLLEKIDALLCDQHLTDDGVKMTVGFLSVGDSVNVNPMSSIEKELDEAWSKCRQLLKDLLKSLDLPIGVDRNWVQNYCMKNATLIFCTASSSYQLHNTEIAPLDVLIVDEAAQVRECELLIPLRLCWLKHVVLVGDDCQLRPMVKSQVCKEAGFGISLFERLVLLDFEKHLLNIQYRMDPFISIFPNARFYEGKILNGPNVLSPSYNKDYMSLPFDSYTFINITDGREEKEGAGNSWRNLIEVAVVQHLIQTIFKFWKSTGQGLSIGVVSPYSAQVDAIKSGLGKKYDLYDDFQVRVKSVDGFQGEEHDIIILSTVRSNRRGVEFLADNQRTNVALTRARHCLWILGNANTLSSSETVWAELVADAQRRNCIFNATSDTAICKLILRVKRELDELDDLLNADSAAFSNTRWKVIFSDNFRKSFAKLKSPQLRREILQKLVKLGSGWRSAFKNSDITDAFQLAKVYRIRDLYLVWSTDLEKNERYFQIIRIWDILSHNHVSRTVQHLDNLFSMYTDDYLDHCKKIQTEGKLEVPIIWDNNHDVIRFKDSGVDDQDDHDHVNTSCAMENTKVNESFLLMKFYSLSSGVAKHLLTATDGTEIDIPFELTDEEEAIIRFPLTSFILGRSGTGKTTVLTMKLIQIEQRSLIASQGLEFNKIDLSGPDDNSVEPMKDTSKHECFLKQVFITVSPKLCSAIKNQICRLKRFGSGDATNQPDTLHMHDIIDDLDEFADLPDNFSNLPREYYPLTVTYRKFLMMLDGTFQTSFFDTFCGEFKSTTERGHSKSRALQAFIESKEVTFEKFAASYWPHFNAELIKKLDPSTVFTEIISHIKGGYQTQWSLGAKLERLDYLKLSDKRFSSLNGELRERIYDVFLDYEKMKCTAREFDLSDFVNSLHSNMLSEGYNGDFVDYIYIDEVQDLTMAQIALLKYVCRNFKEGFVFAGDTAQTIARGIDFRFEDIRSLFYTSFLSEIEGCSEGAKHGKQVHLTDMFQLTQNFRTHCGILRMAQSIMSLLYYFFPSCVDKLNPETGLVYGEAPVLLESGNDENAIMTIFGKSKSGHEHGNHHGFGAEQVILVRDDATKKQIVDLVGKQALVLTIIECKGLEFQDVLLYNFFNQSPLRNKWRVVYEYMKNKHVIALSEAISHPVFDRNKHHLLCSELKQLYVAVTRTRQRLWICENADEYCRPMFDLWKKLCIVEVRLLDSSLIEAMQSGSSTNDWRVRGTKLFNEGQFEMATMCFEKAGDAYREKWARAAGLFATADHVISTNSEMGRASLQKASEIYESIGMHEKAAICYINLGDYKRAGMVYMEKCSISRLEDAGDCFANTEWWSQAAEVYFKAKCYAKCFASCLKGKLFSLGLGFLQQLEKEKLFENNSEVAAVTKTYLENCALHYYEHGDMKQMIPFVKAFNSMDHVRAFLNSRNLIDELLIIEIEMGNFLEAAAIAKHKGDVLLEVTMLEKAELFENATQLLILHVAASSFWDSHNRGWPPKSFAEKDQLLSKAKMMAKQVSEYFFCFACLEADALSDAHKSCARLTYNLLESRKCENLFTELISARSLIDVHFQCEKSGFDFELEPFPGDEMWCYDLLARNLVSPETLVCVWNCWKSVIVKVLMNLRQLENPKSNDSAAVCQDLCDKYFGLRKGDNNRYVVLNMDSSWLSHMGRSSLQQDSNRFWLESLQFRSCAHNFLINELSCIGFSVLEKLQSFVETSLEQSSSLYVQWRIITRIYEIAKFLEKSEFAIAKYSKKLRSFYIRCEHHLFELLSLTWRHETTDIFLCILESPTAFSLIVDSLGSYIRPANKLTHGHLGRITMLLLCTGWLDDMLISKLMQYLDRDSEWAKFFVSLTKFFGSGADRPTLIKNFKMALEFSFTADWRNEPDYMSPVCFVDLLESLGFLASSYLVLNGCLFCTKSILVKMLKSRACKDYLGTCLFRSAEDADLDNMAFSSRRFIVRSIRDILANKSMILEWARKASTPMSLYVPVLLRLVILLYLATTLQFADCYEVTDFLLRARVFEDLPMEFSEKVLPALKMRSRTRNNFTGIFADALAAIGNRMVVLGTPKGQPFNRNLNAYLISCDDLRDANRVMCLLCPKEPSIVKHEPSLHVEFTSCNEPCKVISGNFPAASVYDDNIESRRAIYLTDENIPFWEKFEAFQVYMIGGQNGARIIIEFLRSVISWLKQRGPLQSIDAQLFEEVRHLCNQFIGDEKRARMTVEDLYSMWQDGKDKIQKIMSFLRSEQASLKESNELAEAASAIQFDTETHAEWSDCSDGEPGTGDRDAELELVKEETAAVCSTSKTKATKQKSKKKQKRPKCKGKK